MGINFAKRINEFYDLHWSYHGFHYFRKKLAKEIGIELDNMEGFGGGIPWDKINDSIKKLINHSDCDGYLSPDDCRIIYPRLLELVKNWNNDDYDKIKAIKLAEAMKDCSDNDFFLDFM